MNHPSLQDLKKKIQGEVKNDSMTKHIYSVDASILEVMPELVVLPKNEEDILQTVEFGKEFGIPIIPRGGATGIAGGCLGQGIVIDTSKYLNKIVDFNFEEKWITCEPGVTQDQLNAFLTPYNLRLGPETSTSNRATLGGMCGTNAAGAHFLKYGSMVDHVEEVEIVLSSVEKKRLSVSQPFLPLENLQEEARKIPFPFPHRSSSGYLLSSFHKTPFNPAKITVGSEGSLGIFTKIKLSLSPTLSKTSLVLFSFSSLEKALDQVVDILAFQPISLELLDHHVLNFGKTSPSLKSSLFWLKDDPRALLVAEFENEIPSLFAKNQILTDENQKKSFWALRKGGLGLLLSRRSYSRAIAFIEDLSIPPKHLAPFMKELKKIVPKEMGVYGHAGEGCLHIRPFVDLREPKEVDWMFQTMEEVASLVRSYEGVMSGEHGDGWIRSWLNQRFFGSEIYTLFQKIKDAFDPIHLMNPQKVVGNEHPKPFLRKNSDLAFPTFLNFEKEGGLALSVDLCNGNGECRKKTGLMCPSFHAYGDERHTTRARAQSLRAVLQKQSPLNEEVLDVLDYCLECKGCKTECPSSVDMAKMKMEMLFQYQEKEGYFLLNRLFGNLPSLSKLGSHFAPFSNWIVNSPLTKALLPSFGVAKERSFPLFAKERFSTWFQRRKKSQNGTKIALFNDTYTEFYAPEIGIAAVEVLEHYGYSIELLPSVCCGRPYLSKGLLKQAKENALKLSKVFEETRAPILILEPSCLSAITDDYRGLIGKTFEAKPIEAFLPPIAMGEDLFYHPHCHEQAIGNPQDLRRLFPQNSCHLSSGCCGLAGSFGYEKRHYPMSMEIGEKTLFPQVRSLPCQTPIVASGFSCRSQIEHGTQKKALHLAQYYRRFLR